MPTSATTNYQPAATFDPITISSFKAYDIRGELGVNLDEEIAYRIGRAFAQILYQRYQAAAQTQADDIATLEPAIVIGSDIRHSSEQLKQA
ncbi:hypothetical protein R0K04_22180, partial [Pseudoalteromonas sp. SIMBA_153]